MRPLKLFLKKCFTPITILVVPHSKSRPFQVKVSFVTLLAFGFLCLTGAGYVASVCVDTIEYYAMKKELSYLVQEFDALKSTISSLKKADIEFTRLLSLKSRNTILETADFKDTGALDIESLKKQVNESIRSVFAIRKFIAEQKDLYIATPSGWPIQGEVSSYFGQREHPVTGERSMHTGVDIRAHSGTPVYATAPGIVSFSGWTDGSGYIIVLEHGYGFSTAYAHNKKNHVAVGQKVKKGELIASSGSTGMTTGAHLHYEVWKDSRQIDPSPYLKETK
ncbi:MAG TPA: M23 family metallopeptidase [Syntrophorhabdaceae bacterium]|nr:M23 family metallopeptidase [Syntrophorhabdaceae bacterium]HQM80422.1 M23 family metallopeptidase [Syntrophorhabdaceae bacterium]